MISNRPEANQRARGLIQSARPTRAARSHAVVAGERTPKNVAWTGMWAAAWYVTILVSLFVAPRLQWMADGYVADTTSALQRNIQLGASIFIVLGVITGRKTVLSFLREGRRSAASLALLVAVVAMFLNACLRPNMTEVVYVAIFGLSLLLGIVLWSSAPTARLLFMRAIVVSSTIFTVAAFAVYGQPVGRWVGGIHPNLFGFVLVASAATTIVFRSKFSWLVYAFALASAVAISSRYALLIILSLPAFGLWAVLAKRTNVFAATVSTLLALVLATAVALPILSQVFRLDDPTRGLSSGVSGRADLNAYFLSQLTARPITGYGFRLRENYIGTHNGYLNMFLENGVIIGLAVLAAVLISVGVTLWRVKGRDRTDGPEPMFALYIISGCVLAAAFQPQLINFGDAQGTLLILTLGYPCVLAARRSRRKLTPGDVTTATPARGAEAAWVGARAPPR